MKIRYRRLLLVGCYVALLAVVAVIAGYVGRNFTGAGPTPTRAAFAGRFPSTPEGDWRRCQLFYATNRAVDDEATFGGQGSKLGTQVSMGT